MNAPNGKPQGLTPNQDWTRNAAKLARQLVVISEIARTALGRLEVGDLLFNVASSIHKHFGFYDVSIFLVDPDTHDCVLVANAGDFHPANVQGYRQKVGVGIVGWVAEHGETLLANDIRQEPRYIAAFPGEEQSLSELAVPIRLHDRTVGVINVENREPGAFDECDAMALETLAGQVAQAIANAQLFERTRLLRDLNRSIVDAIPSGLIVVDESLDVVYANPAFRRLFGTGDRDLAGLPMREILPMDLLERAGIGSLVERAVKENRSEVITGVTIGAGTDEKILNVRITSAQMPEGRGVLMVFEDVTAWRKASALAEQRLRHLDRIVSHVPVAVISWDSEGRFNFWGSGAERLFGRPEAEVLGKVGIRDVFEDPEALDRLLRRCQAEGSAEAELFIRRSDGSRVPVLAIVGRLDDAGQQSGYTATVIDVTERRRAEESILREKQKLENVVRLVGAGLALVDRQHQVVWANETLRNWFGPARVREGANAHLICCRAEQPSANCPTARCFATVRSCETELRLVRSDGATRQYHVAVTPIAGSEQVLLLMLDVTEQARKIYQLSRLRQLGELMQGVLDLDRLLHFVLTCVTAGQGLGFNRAVLMLVDRDRQVLEGRMGVGPGSAEEAGRIWSQIVKESYSLEDLLRQYDQRDRQAPSAVDQLARGIRIPLSEKENIFLQCLIEKKPIVVREAARDPRISEEFRRAFGAHEFLVVPLIARNEAVGVVVADNLYTRDPITEDDVELLCMFANQAAIAIENAENYQRLEEEKAHLEQAYRELADAQDKLLRSERLVTIGRMAAHIAHEIRNPLVNIGGFARAIAQRQEMPRETVMRHANIIASEVQRLENILQRVMDFTKPPRPLMRAASLRAVIQETIEQVRQRASEQRVEIVCRFPEEDPVLMIDPDQMKQVFINLLHNALDAMKDGGLVEVTMERSRDEVAVSFRNTGPPIHPDDLANLFIPFFSTKPGGTGLGLTVSQKIVQDHGGDIRASSSAERGTEFVVSLPLTRPPETREGYSPASRGPHG